MKDIFDPQVCHFCQFRFLLVIAIAVVDWWILMHFLNIGHSVSLNLNLFQRRKSILFLSSQSLIGQHQN